MPLASPPSSSPRGAGTAPGTPPATPAVTGPGGLRWLLGSSPGGGIARRFLLLAAAWPLAAALAIGLPEGGNDDAQLAALLVLAAAVAGQAGLILNFAARIDRQEEARRWREADLVDRETHFRQLCEFLPQLVWTCAPDGAADYLGPQWEAYTGRPAEEQLGWGWITCLHPEDRIPTQATWLAACKRSATFDAEFRLRHHDGTYRWFHSRAQALLDEEGRVCRWFGTSTDIDELRKGEQAIRRSEARLRRALAAGQRRTERQALLLDIASGLLVVDLGDHDAASLDRYIFDKLHTPLEVDICLHYRLDPEAGCLRLVAGHGIPAESRPGLESLQLEESMSDLIPGSWAFQPPAASPAPPPAGAGPMQRLGVRCHASYPLLARDGRLLGTFCLASTRRNHFTPGETDFLQTVAVLLALGIERRQAEEKIQRLNADLERQVEARTAELRASNRELQAFTYAASHDLKAPLGRINSFSSLLEKQYRDLLEGDGLLFLDFIRSNATRMTNLIEDMLAHARIEQQTANLQAVDLRGAVQSALEERRSEIREAEAEIRCHLPAIEVWADPLALGQVLRNLIDNALKYSAQANPPIIEIGGEARDGKCRLWVRDNGVGFDMAHHDQIFEIFRRLHTYAEFPGSGVGLALVKKAMERMEGRVWAESAPAKGATFFLEMQA